MDRSVVGRDRHKRVILTKLKVSNISFVCSTSEDADGLTLLRIPHSDECSFLGGGGEEVGVGPPADDIDALLVAAEGVEFDSGFGCYIPHASVIMHPLLSLHVTS